jgi:hypothetical protein
MVTTEHVSKHAWHSGDSVMAPLNPAQRGSPTGKQLSSLSLQQFAADILTRV